MMDDLTELSEGWGQPEPPSHAARSAARAALLQQAAAPEVMPAPGRPTGQWPAQRPAPAARRSRRRAGWLAGAAGLTAAVAVAVAAVMAGIPGTASTAGGGDRAAAAAHRRAAATAASKLSAHQILLDAAAAAAAAPPRTGRYWEVKQVIPGPPRPSSHVTFLNRDGVEYNLAPDGREVYRPGGDCGFSVGGRWLTYGQLQHLPTGPAALKAWLTWSFSRRGWQPLSPCARAAVPAAPRPRWSRSALTSTGTVGTALVSLLYEVPSSPALRAAAFRALASMPGVRKDGYADGGVVLLIDVGKVPASKFPSGKVPRGDNGIEKLIIDPATFALRADSSYQGTTRILAAGWTDHMPKVVSADKLFPPNSLNKPSQGSG